MQVLVVFEFEDLQVDSEEAQEIIETITADTRVLRADYDASDCWVQEAYDTAVEGKPLDVFIANSMVDPDSKLYRAAVAELSALRSSNNKEIADDH